jgi:hypothetical protein
MYQESFRPNTGVDVYVVVRNEQQIKPVWLENGSSDDRLKP